MGDIERYLRILGLEPGASLDEVREAYRDLAKVWHPDRFSEEDLRLKKKALEKTREIVEAYDFLTARLKGAVTRPRPGAESPEDRPSGETESSQEPGRFSFHHPPPPRRGPGLGWLLKGIFLIALFAAGVLAAAKIVDLKLDRYFKKEVPDKAAKAAEDLFGMLSTEKPDLAQPLDMLRGPVRVGMTAEQVLDLKGEPDRKDKYSIGEVWWYGKSSIKFEDRKVVALKDKGELAASPGKGAGKAASKRLYQYRDKEGRIIITDTPREEK